MPNIGGGVGAELYQVAPKEFVAARNRLVKELRAAGRKDDAASVAALRRPRVPEFALNRAAATSKETVDRYVDAVHAVEAAQRRAIEKGDGGALRRATEELRTASGELVDAAVAALDDAGERGSAQRTDVIDLLRTLVSGPALDQLRAGVLGSADIPAEIAEEGDVPMRPIRRATEKGTKTRTAKPAATTTASRSSSRAESAAARREARRREQEEAAARRRLAGELRRARSQVELRERDVARARESLADAETALRDAQRELAELAQRDRR